MKLLVRALIIGVLIAAYRRLSRRPCPQPGSAGAGTDVKQPGVDLPGGHDGGALSAADGATGTGAAGGQPSTAAAPAGNDFRDDPWDGWTESAAAEAASMHDPPPHSHPAHPYTPHPRTPKPPVPDE